MDLIFCLRQNIRYYGLPGTIGLAPSSLPWPTAKVSNKTHTSLTDPDASLAFKAGTPGGLKYKIHLSVDADSRVILAIQATTGACHDSQPYLNQLNTIEHRYQLSIKETTADRAYGSAEIIEALVTKGIHPYIPLFNTRSGSFVPQETEGIIYESKHRHGLKRARYRGLVKVQIQALMGASVQNIKRIVNFLLFIFYCENILISHS
ncbi:MAG: hypothetical protein LEGION0398_MBIBDBAK_01069 [Legionellaceae bacterium]